MMPNCGTGSNLWAATVHKMARVVNVTDAPAQKKTVFWTQSCPAFKGRGERIPPLLLWSLITLLGQRYPPINMHKVSKFTRQPSLYVILDWSDRAKCNYLSLYDHKYHTLRTQDIIQKKSLYTKDKLKEPSTICLINWHFQPQKYENLSNQAFSLVSTIPD